MKLLLLMMWTTLVYLNIYDGITTCVLLEHGGTEVSPVAKWFINQWGINGLLCLKVLVILFLTGVTGWIADSKLIYRQKAVVIGSYLVAIIYYLYVMLKYNHAYMQSFNVPV